MIGWFLTASFIGPSNSSSVVFGNLGQRQLNQPLKHLDPEMLSFLEACFDPGNQIWR